MNDEERRELVDRYREGPSVVRRALDGVTPDELDHRPVDGWSAREVVHHLADSEMTSAVRLRVLLAESDPMIAGYDEAAFATVFRYGERPIEPALAALDAARATTAQILEMLGSGDWSRAGIHSESGRYSVEDWLRIYAAHAHDHAGQILRSRSGARNA
jgi:hypothetical protein